MARCAVTQPCWNWTLSHACLGFWIWGGEPGAICSTCCTRCTVCTDQCCTAGSGGPRTQLRAAAPNSGQRLPTPCPPSPLPAISPARYLPSPLCSVPFHSLADRGAVEVYESLPSKSCLFHVVLPTSVDRGSLLWSSDYVVCLGCCCYGEVVSSHSWDTPKCLP